MGIAMGIAMVLLWYCYGIAMEGLECCYGGRDFLSNTWGSNLSSQFSGSFKERGESCHGLPPCNPPSSMLRDVLMPFLSFPFTS